MTELPGSPPAGRPRVSACIIAFNEEKKIRRCLESVRWCDEIVVVDSFSTDRTVEICREYTDHIVQHTWLGYVNQRNLIRELAQGPWLLYLDADEEVSEALRDEILERFERGVGEVVGFEFPRMVYYLGRWIRHGEWYPDRKLRLFRKDCGRTEGEEPHDRVVVHGRVERLRNPIFHYTYDNLEDHLRTVNRFSTIAARRAYVNGKRFHLRDFLLHPPFRFLKAYLLRLGFLDGFHGLLIATISAFASAVKYAKLWELHRMACPDWRAWPEQPPKSFQGKGVLSLEEDGNENLSDRRGRQARLRDSNGVASGRP